MAIANHEDCRLNLRTGVKLQKLEEVKVTILFFCKDHIGPVNCVNC